MARWATRLVTLTARARSTRRVPRLACALALSSLAWLTPACGGRDASPPPAQDVRIATGLPGGVYRPYGTALAEVINRFSAPLRASALTTQGSVDNLMRLAGRRAEIAFTLADTAGVALAGGSPFARPVKIAALARLYDDYVQVIARADSDLDDVRDLARKRVSIGAPRSGTALTAKRILAVRSLRLQGERAPRTRSLPLGESAKALADGDIDAFFWSGGLPTEAITKLLRSGVRIKLLDLPIGIARDLDPNLFTETQIPRFVYRTGRPARTVAAANLLVVRRDLPDDLAYRFTRLLFEHQRVLEAAHPEARRLNARSAIATYPLDLHPGAERYYQEAAR